MTLSELSFRLLSDMENKNFNHNISEERNYIHIKFTDKEGLVLISYRISKTIYENLNGKSK